MSLPASQIFVNLPVEDLNRSVSFFTRLGFTFDPRFTDESATCMLVGENIFVMLLTRERYAGFTPKAVADAKGTSQVLIALSLQSRKAVDDMVRNAVEAGGSIYAEPRDHGWMYQHSFEDPDGHQWEVMHADITQFKTRPEQPKGNPEQ